MLRLEPATGLKNCSFCSREICDDIKYGQLFKLGDNGIHQFCLLLSWNITHYRNPGDSEIDFDRREVYNVLEESRNTICVYCKEYGATLRCFNFNCKKTFHLPCGLENDSMHLFFNHYETYCSQHRIVQEVPSDLETQESMICAICQDGIIGKVSPTTLWASCCAKQTWFHRECVQRHAFHAGYEMRCPCCNDESKFKEEMSKQGIRITNECPSWLGGRMVRSQGFVNMCAAGSCNCPYGRSFTNGEWLLRVCASCTVRRIHRYCGRRNMCGQCYESTNNGSDDESMHNHPPTVDDLDAFHENREFTLGPLLEPERYFRRLMGMPVDDIPDIRPMSTGNIPPLVRRSSLDNMSVSDVLSNESSFEEDDDIVRQLFTDDIADSLSGGYVLGLSQPRSLGITDLVHRAMTNSENDSDDIAVQELFTAHNIRRGMEENGPSDFSMSATSDNIEPYSLWSYNRSTVPTSTSANSFTAVSDNSLFTTAETSRSSQALQRTLVDDNENRSLQFGNNLSSTVPEGSSLFSYFRNGNDHIAEHSTREDTIRDASLGSSAAIFEGSINGSGIRDCDYRICWPAQSAIVNAVSTESVDRNALTNSELPGPERSDPLSVTPQSFPRSGSNDVHNEIDNGEVHNREIQTVTPVLVDGGGRKNMNGFNPPVRNTLPSSMKGNVETRTSGMIRRGFMNSRVIINSPLERQTSTISNGQSSNSNAQSTYTPLPAPPPSFLRGFKIEASPSDSLTESHINKLETEERIPKRAGLHPVNTNGRRGITAPLPSFLRNRITNVNGSQNSVEPTDNISNTVVEGNSTSGDRGFRSSLSESMVHSQANSSPVGGITRRNESDNGNLRDVMDNTQLINERHPSSSGNLSSLEHFNIGMTVGMGIMCDERGNTERSTAFNNDRISERHLDNNHYHHQQQRTVPIYHSLNHPLPLPQPLPICVLNDARNSTRTSSSMYSQNNNNGLMFNNSCNQRFTSYACLLCCVECSHSQNIMLPQCYPTVANSSQTENVHDCMVRTE